jgi:hypothetical protein
MALQLLNVESRSTGGDCFEELLISLCAWYNRRYEMMYVRSLYYDYLSNDSTKRVGDRLQTNSSEEYHILLEQYHGLKFQFLMNASIEQDIELIGKQLQEGRPVIIAMDSYYIPWDPKYFTSHHLGHVFIAVGFDPDTKALYGTDPFFNKITQRVSYKDLQSGYQGYITVETDNEELKNIHALVSEVRRHLLECMRSKETFNAIAAFAEELRAIDFQAEMEEIADFGNSVIFLNLGRIIRGRTNYTKLLQYLDEFNSIKQFEAVVEQLKQISFIWVSARGFITKGYLLKDPLVKEAMLENAISKLNEIAELEEKVIKQLLESLHNQENGMTSPVIGVSNSNNIAVPDTLNTEIQFLQLSYIFNCRGFENDLNTADLDSQGYYFSQVRRPMHNLVEIEQMSFRLDENPDNGYDNAACYGQTIDLKADHYDSLMVLGCSEMGSFLDKITIEYEDHTTEIIAFGFSDWYMSNAINEEVIAYKGLMAQKEQGVLTHEVNLYAKRTELKRDKKAVRMMLPMAPNIHLFAVSLSKQEE